MRLLQRRRHNMVIIKLRLVINRVFHFNLMVLLVCFFPPDSTLACVVFLYRLINDNKMELRVCVFLQIMYILFGINVCIDHVTQVYLNNDIFKVKLVNTSYSRNTDFA